MGAFLCSIFLFTLDIIYLILCIIKLMVYDLILNLLMFCICNNCIAFKDFGLISLKTKVGPFGNRHD